MKRNQLKLLKLWKNRNDRKPLILNGARQVGKTWLIKEFGKAEYQSVAYINFEDNLNFRKIFDEGFDIPRILQGIQAATGIKPELGNTLIFFDEIQLSPRALTSLKYFNENANSYHIACAGSMLGIALANQSSFPVGQVEFIDLYPLNFEEFLEASGEDELLKMLQAKDWSLIKVFASRFSNLLRTYYFTGGMPEVVADYLKNNSFEQVRTIQNNILRTYELDFSKHAPGRIVPRIRMLWDSIPSQLAKENRKFIYNAVKPGSRAKEFELALHWLIDAGLIHKINNVSAPKLPLKAYEDLDSFKLFLLDIGLLLAKADLESAQVITHSEKVIEFKGAYTEQYVLQQLKTTYLKKAYYWSSSNQKSEIDFLVEGNKNIWPIEVKASENLQSKSLRVYYEKYKPPFAIRTSMSDFRIQDWLMNIPLYGINQLPKIISEQ